MVHVTKVRDMGDDVLRVWGWIEGVNDDHGRPLPLEATGWVSALTNYVPSGLSDDERAATEPRQATKAEATAYCQELLQAGAPPADAGDPLALLT